MITNEILKEKYKVQKQLAEAAKDIHDYFTRTHKSAQQILNSTGVTTQQDKHANKAPTK